MKLIAIAEFLSCLFVGISIVSQMVSDDGTVGSRRIRLCTLLTLVWLIADGLAYSVVEPCFGSYWLTYVVHFLAFTIGGVNLIAFMAYADAYIRGQGKLGRLTFLVPQAVVAVGVAIVVYRFAAGRIITFGPGAPRTIGGIPDAVMATYLVALFYTSAVAFAKRGIIGAKAVVVISIYAILPAVAVVLMPVLEYDFSVLASGFAVTVVAELLQNDLINRRRKEAEKANLRLESANRHEKLRADALDFLMKNDSFDEFLEFLFGRILSLYDCDQVIYRDAEGVLKLKTRPGTPPLDFSLCADCPHYSFDAPVYAGGFTVMNDCRVGYNGIPVHRDCRVRASLTYLVYQEEDVFGYVALHYLDRTHRFSDYENDTFDRIAKFISVALTRRKHQKRNKALVALSKQCISVFDVDLTTGLYEIVKHPDTTTVMDRADRRWDLALGRDFAAECVGETRKAVEKLGSVDFLREELADANHREYAYSHRLKVGGSPFRRCTTLALERDDGGAATRVLVDFVAVDDNQAKIIEQRELIEQQQRKLLEAEALEKANRAKSYFFSMVSHDIRTPLNAIIGYAELLKLGMASEAERDKAIDSVLVSGHTLLELINDVLDLSKLEAGKMDILPEPVDPKRLIDEVVDAFRATIGGKPVEIRSVVGRMPWLKFDPHRIRQILFNLVGNAVKFTDEGYVEIRADYESAGRGLGTFRFSVADTGCGISEEDQRRVALPYVQVGTESSRGKGTGLGLAICKQLVARMEGEFRLESKLGSGSVFTVTIPNVEEEKGAERDGLSTTQRIQVQIDERAPYQGRVLVVDDVAMNRMVLRSMLRKLGVVSVDMAENGFGALKQLEEAGPFDLVLTDVWMPGMDGERLVREIRKNPVWTQLPVYAVTADIEAQKSYLGMGFSGVLLKPVTLEKLEEFFRTEFLASKETR